MDAKACRWMLIAAVLWILGGIGLPNSPKAAQAQTSVSLDVGFFYDRLAPYGDWREHPTWGWVWSPRGMAVSWRPYTLGHWAYTDDFGWLWESDLDWGWACFHYGRWDWDDDFGWFWVPGFDWGPAWVAWRTGPEFIGWCPLPPVAGWQVGVGLELHGLDLNDLPARRWVFVPAPFFAAPRLHEHIVLMSRNVTLFGETRNVTRFESVEGRVVNNSISARQIEEFTHRPVERFRVRHVDSAAAMRLPHEGAGEIHVFSPRVRPGPAGLMPPRPGELERRQGAERSQLQEQQRAEESRQQERFRTERAAPGGATEQLQRQQEAERRALQSEHERQQRLLENRHQHQREEFGLAQGGPEGRRPRTERQ
jgi:hypothetical protein